MNKYLALCFSFLALFTAAGAEPLTIGEVLPSFKAKDQHGQDFELQPGVRRLFVSFDMSTGKDANTYFAAKGADFLKNSHAVYLSNIHGMPRSAAYSPFRKCGNIRIELSSPIAKISSPGIPVRRTASRCSRSILI